MTPYEYLSDRLTKEMFEGNMHATLRDVGRLAGGLVASGGMPRRTYLPWLPKLNRCRSIRRKANASGAKPWPSVATSPCEWDQCPQKPDRALDWDSVIGGSYNIVDPNRVQAGDVPRARGVEPRSPDFRIPDRLVFDRRVCWFLSSSLSRRDGKKLPTRGNYSQTAGELLANLERYKDVGAVFGDVDPRSGMDWLNPLDGQGVCDKNVTDFRFALVESDRLQIDQQYGIYKSWNYRLPRWFIQRKKVTARDCAN